MNTSAVSGTQTFVLGCFLGQEGILALNIDSNLSTIISHPPTNFLLATQNVWNLFTLTKGLCIRRKQIMPAIHSINLKWLEKRKMQACLRQADKMRREMHVKNDGDTITTRAAAACAQSLDALLPLIASSRSYEPQIMSRDDTTLTQSTNEDNSSSKMLGTSTSKRRRQLPEKEEQEGRAPLKRTQWRKDKKICSHTGCTNQAKVGGVCNRHGAKRCSRKGCRNIAKQGGMCQTHVYKVWG